jgi:hypothetical protein
MVPSCPGVFSVISGCEVIIWYSQGKTTYNKQINSSVSDLIQTYVYILVVSLFVDIGKHSGMSTDQVVILGFR